MSDKMNHTLIIIVGLITWIDTAVTNPTATSTRHESGMLNLTSASNCASLGYPGAIPHILNGYEKGPGRCCFPISSKVGGFITMCPKNGVEDEWRPCPPGTCNKHHITSENQVWIDHLSSDKVCKKSADCINQDDKKEIDVKKVYMTLEKDNGLVSSLVQDGNEDPDTSKSIDLTPGVYELTCIAEGGVPDPKFTITFSGGTLSRSSKITLDLTPGVSFVTCSVQVGDRLPNHEACLNIHVKSVEPEINCGNVSALLGDRRAVMDCTVTAPDVTCKKVVWQSGLSGKEITHGGSKTPGAFVSCKNVGQDRIWTQLELRDLEEEDFEDTYYVKVKGGPGGDYQQGHKIKRKSLTHNKSSTMTATSTLVFVALHCLYIVIGR